MLDTQIIIEYKSIFLKLIKKNQTKIFKKHALQYSFSIDDQINFEKFLSMIILRMIDYMFANIIIETMIEIFSQINVLLSLKKKSFIQNNALNNVMKFLSKKL